MRLLTAVLFLLMGSDPGIVRGSDPVLRAIGGQASRGGAVSQQRPTANLPRPDAWPQFRGDPALTGISSSVLPAALKLLWTYDAGDAIESSAAIVDGTVFVGSGSGDLIALNLQTGSVRWKYHAAEIGESSPTVANGIVYIGDLTGVLHAVDVQTGKALWTFKTQGEIRSSPIVVADKVLIGSYDRYLYGLSALLVGAGMCLLDWQLGLLVLAGFGPLAALTLWFRRESAIAYRRGREAIAAIIVHFVETFRGIRASDGKEMFKTTIGAYMGASPALLGDVAYIGTFDNDVIGVSLRSRRVLWTYHHPERHFPFYSSAAVAQGRVVIGGRDKMVHALNAATGKAVWTFMTNARIESSPAIVGSRVFVGSNDGRLYELDLATGSKKWEFDTGAAVPTSPAIAGGRIVIGAQDGRLYCFG